MRKKVTFPIILIVSVILLYGVYRTFFINFQGQDLSAPVLEGPEEISWELGREFVFSPAEHGITAKDDQDGDVSAKITYEGTVDVHTEGSYDVRYHVSDKAGNQSEHVLNVHVKKTSVVSSRQLMYADPHTIIPEIVDPDSMTVLVNKQHAIPDGWAPNDLVPITSNSERDMYLRSEAAAAWERLNQAALERGLHIWVVSSYRTAAYQESLFNGYYASNGEADYIAFAPFIGIQLFFCTADPPCPIAVLFIKEIVHIKLHDLITVFFPPADEIVKFMLPSSSVSVNGDDNGFFCMGRQVFLFKKLFPFFKHHKSPFFLL